MGFTYENENELEGHHDYDDEEDYEAEFQKMKLDSSKK